MRIVPSGDYSVKPSYPNGNDIGIQIQLGEFYEYHYFGVYKLKIAVGALCF